MCLHFQTPINGHKGEDAKEKMRHLSIIFFIMFLFTKLSLSCSCVFLLVNGNVLFLLVVKEQKESN